MDAIKNEWTTVSDSLINNLQSDPSFLEEGLNVSDETIDCFYRCGFRLYEHQQYQEAADAFYVISLLSSRRHNVWMALGLSEKELNHHEEALVAFSMAALTNMEDPLSFLHSAECYIALGEKEDAKECLEVVANCVKRNPDHESKQIASYALSLKKTLL
jgi:type III secretion system low calcium response chaperone LcrH/SycD